MRVFAQLCLLCVGFSSALPSSEINEIVDTPVYSNNIRGFNELHRLSNDELRPLKKVFLSNRTITCNDGSRAGFFLRKSHTSKKWIIFLEGGWYCIDHHTCQHRWMKQRHFMTSSNWPDARSIGGILSGNADENPFWFDANHVYVPYCSSDAWSGTKIKSHNEMFSFMGSLIVRQVVLDVLPFGLENGTQLMLAGSSAGAIGVMLNLDPVKELLHDEKGLRRIRVKGVSDSGWFLDRTPYLPTVEPAVEGIKRGIELWKGEVPRRCREMYPTEPWRCYFGYRVYPTLQSELFVFQWVFDEAQMDVDNVGTPVSQKQWDYIHKMGVSLRRSFDNVTGVFAPSCISHSVLTKRDWQRIQIDDISVAEALHCWDQKTNRRKLKRPKNSGDMVADQPSADRDVRGHKGKKRQHNSRPRKRNGELKAHSSENSTLSLLIADEDDEKVKKAKRKKQKRKNQKNRKNRRGKQGQVQEDSILGNGSRSVSISSSTDTTSNPIDKRSQRSLLHSQSQRKRSADKHCRHRKVEKCTWPQCNHSCPRLHNPLTGEEMDFVDLLISFGLNMESVALALGIDMQTLDNMEHSELLNLLTQQVK